MMRSTLLVTVLVCGAAPALLAQYLDGTSARRHDGTMTFVRRADVATWRRAAPHYGKWLTAAGSGAGGRYLRADAESLYQSSRTYDRRANRWRLGAQASLIATAALFIIDLHPGEGPDNIPFAPVRVGLAALPGAAPGGMRGRA